MHTHTHTYIYIYIYIHAHTHTYICIYTHTHIHTHTHIYICHTIMLIGLFSDIGQGKPNGLSFPLFMGYDKLVH